MKKKILSLALVAVMSVGLLSGCGSSKEAPTAAETYDVLENPAITVDGKWSAPDTDRSVTFNADGTYTSTIATKFSTDSLSGNYVYYSQNDSFKLADAFKNEEYVVLSNEKGKETLFGTVLGDVMVCFYDQNQCYFFRDKRTTAVSLSDFTGNWKDVTGGTYELKLKDDGTCVMGEDDKMDTYTYTYDESNYRLTVNNGNSDQVYTVGMFEGYLFLMLNGNNYTMYMYERQ